MKAAVEFSEKQISDWRAFEKVRQSGKWNMFDPKARAATGLSGEEYSFTMSNYDALKEAALAAQVSK